MTLHVGRANAKRVRLGKRCQVEPGALVGYRPHRPLGEGRLLIGDDSLIMTGAILYTHTVIGQRAQIGHYAIVREENRIGDDLKLWAYSVIDYGCRIGHRVKIHHHVYVGQYSQIDNDVFIAPGVVLANERYPGQGPPQFDAPHLETGAQIGINVSIAPGVTIGAHALVGSGSVVTKDVPAYAIAYGNPARIHNDVRQLAHPAQRALLA